MWANRTAGPITLSSSDSFATDLLFTVPGTLKNDSTILDIEVIQNISQPDTLSAAATRVVDYWAGLYIAQEGLLAAALPDPGSDIEEVDWLHRWHFFARKQEVIAANFAEINNIHQEDQVKTKRRFHENGRTLYFVVHNLAPDLVTYSHFFRTLLLVS